MGNILQLTKKGFEAIKKELEHLLSVKRPKLVKRLSNARSQGDLSENSDYQNAKEELEFMDGRIAELEHVLKTAKVVNGNGRTGSVEIGAKVKVKINGQISQFEIVGDMESDPLKGKISLNSPIGTALSGGKAKDKVEVSAPAGNVVYEIVSIQ